jgi:hypothetical protein
MILSQEWTALSWVCPFHRHFSRFGMGNSRVSMGLGGWGVVAAQTQAPKVFGAQAASEMQMSPAILGWPLSEILGSLAKKERRLLSRPPGKGKIVLILQISQ